MFERQIFKSTTLTRINEDLLFDEEHILMNYLKMFSFSETCFKDTNIKVSPYIMDLSLSPIEIIQRHNKFSSKYFTLFLENLNAMDVLGPMICNYPNTELGFFLCTILNKHIITLISRLDKSKELFEKYKNDLFKIFNYISQVNKKEQLLESICSSISIIIIIGINGFWTNGLDQLIDASKTNNSSDIEKITMASLIISNIKDIFEKLKDKLSSSTITYIRIKIKEYSNAIKEFSTFLISKVFNGQKDFFVNTLLFKGFIGIVQSFQYFNLNILTMYGFMDFLINCILYLDSNKDLVLKICDVFEQTFNDKAMTNFCLINNFPSIDY